jgi:hypothetical protein
MGVALTGRAFRCNLFAFVTLSAVEGLLQKAKRIFAANEIH